MKSLVLKLTGFSILLSSPFSHIYAQDTGSLLEEIIVQARRYEESLQDAPVSVNVMSAEYLEDQGIEKVSDIIEFSPGTTYIRFNKLQDEYSMRGISSQTEGTSGDSSVQSVIDNVVISKDFMKNPAFYDMERVEILRGPQGTSFGRNATAGLVHLITKRPTDEFEAGVTLGAGSHDSYEVEGYVSGAVTETLSGRLAARFSTYDGYTEDTVNGRGLDGQENTSVRGSFLFRPSSDLTIFFKAEVSQDDDEAPVRRSLDCSQPQLVFVPPGPPQFHPTFGGGPGAANSAPITSFPDYTDPCDVWETQISPDREFFLDRDIVNLTGEITWDITDGLTLTSVTGYIDGDTAYLIDAQGTPSSVLFQNTTNDASSFTQELRLDNHAAGEQLRWLLGLYYLSDEHDRFDENRFFEQPGGPVGRSAQNPLTLDTKISTGETESIGIFGEISYDLTDRLNGTFGFRWSGDEKDYAIAHTAIGWAPKATAFVQDVNGICIFPGPPGFINTGCATTIGFATPVTTSANWDDFSIKASAQYSVTDDVMVYGLYSEGYKTGGFQPEPFNVADAARPFNPETATTYEAGFKGEWGGRFRLNGSFFFTEYEDLQVTQFLAVGQGFRSFISNAATVESLGLELEYIWQMTDNFRVSGSYANFNTEFEDTRLFAEDNINGGNVLTDFSGTRPDNTPEWTGTLALEYVFPFDDGSSLTVRGDWRGRSDAFDDIGEQANRLRPSANVFGARATWSSSNEKWSVAVWAKNLSEEEQILNIGPPQPDTFRAPIAFGEPRTFGGTVSYRFD